MFDHDADKMRGAGLTAFNPLAVSKAMPEPRPLPSFEMLERLEHFLRADRFMKSIQWPILPDPIEATGATGCLSSPEYPKGMNGPTGGDPPTVNIPKDWCIRMAQLEGDTEIGAGPFARDPTFDDADREEGGFLPFLRGEDRVMALEVENAELKRRLTVLEATGNLPDEEIPYKPQGQLTSISHKAWRMLNQGIPYRKSDLDD